MAEERHMPCGHEQAARTRVGTAHYDSVLPLLAGTELLLGPRDNFLDEKLLVGIESLLVSPRYVLLKPVRAGCRTDQNQWWHLASRDLGLDQCWPVLFKAL